jgi:hypothetical protein
MSGFNKNKNKCTDQRGTPLTGLTKIRKGLSSTEIKTEVSALVSIHIQHLFLETRKRKYPTTLAQSPSERDRKGMLTFSK